jgi:hypothetical protein
MKKYRLMHAVSRSGFTHVEIIPYDLVHARTPAFLVRHVRDLAFILEHAPVIRDFCGTLYISAKKPGDEQAGGPPSRLRNTRRSTDQLLLWCLAGTRK